MSYLNEAYPNVYEEDLIIGAANLPRSIIKFLLASNKEGNVNRSTPFDKNKPAVQYLLPYYMANNFGPNFQEPYVLGANIGKTTLLFKRTQIISFRIAVGAVGNLNVRIRRLGSQVNSMYRITLAPRVPVYVQLLQFTQALVLHQALMRLIMVYTALPTLANFNACLAFVNNLNRSNLSPPGWTYRNNTLLTQISGSLNAFDESVDAFPAFGVNPPAALNDTPANRAAYAVAVYNGTVGINDIPASNGNTGNGVALSPNLINRDPTIIARGINLNEAYTGQNYSGDTFFDNPEVLDSGDIVTNKITVQAAYHILQAGLP